MKNGTIGGNKINILETVKRYGPVSIKDVAALCSLSIPSTTAIIDPFIEEGLLSEEISMETAPGRPPKLICVNPDYGFTVGVDLGIIDHANIGFFCASGRMIAKIKINLSAVADVINHIIDEIMAAIEGFEGKRGKLLSIVIANPGIVNPETGSMTNAAHNVSWAHLPITRLFSKAFGVKVTTHNDINLSALGEKMRGAGKGYSNLVMVRADIGIKAGVIIDGALYQGETGAAGEIGRNVIILKYPGSGRIRVETTEALLSLDMILQRIAEELPNHPDDILNTLVGADRSLMSLDHILKALGSDNSFVCDIVKEAGMLLGYVIANLTASLDIGIVIVGGDMVKLNHYIFKSMRDAAATVVSPPPTIISSTLGEDVALWGAALVGWEHVIQKLAEPSS